MHRKAVPQPLGGYALVQDGEVHRVEGCVAQPRQGGSHHQPPIALGRARHQPRGRKTRQRKEHDGPRAHPVYQKARQGLAHPGDHKEHGHQHPEFGIAEAELGNQPREQRGQQHVKEVRAAMGQAHQADGAGVLPKRHGAG